MNISSKVLIEGIKSHSDMVISMLYRNHLPLITRYVVNNNGNKEDAKDIYQDALIVLYEKIQSTDQKNFDALAYLTVVCKNLWLLKLRSKKKETNIEFELEEGNLMDEVLHDIKQIQQFEIYRKHFKNLGQKCQTILKLFFAKHSMNEIAKKLNTTEHYAKKSKYKCQKKLIENIRSDKKFKEVAD